MREKGPNSLGNKKPGGLQKGIRTTLNPPPNISAISGMQLAENPVTAYDLEAENPQDIYPVAEAFWQMTLSTLADLPKDETLYVFLGESHDCPSHKMTQAAILSLASEWRAAARGGENRNFIFAREKSFNDLVEIGKKYKLEVPDCIKYTLPSEDPEGKVYGRAIGALTSALTPLTSSQLYAHTLKKEIPLVLTDCNILKAIFGTVLDPLDPIWPDAASLLDRKQSEISYRLHPSKRDGMAWRNASMVVREQQAATNLNARIVFKQGGRSHLLGDRCDNLSPMMKADRQLPFEESWLTLHQKAGNKAIGLVLTKNAEIPEKIIEPDALQEHKNNIMFVRGLDYKSHIKQYPNKEQAYLDTLKQAFSGPAEYFPEVVSRPDKDEIRSEVEAAIKRAVGKVQIPPPDLA